MGHDHHFLSRLDRVDLHHAETALGLYRDHERVRVLLDLSSAPRTAERVAISLDHPVEGPFIIVARDGHFVTCLSRGMRVSIPVIDRQEFDQMTTHTTGLRTAAKSLSEGQTRRDILQMALVRGERLLAEDLTEIRVVLPLMDVEIVKGAQELGNTLVELLPDVRRVLKRKGARARRVAADYTKALWRYRNHLMLLGMCSEAFKDKVVRGMRPLLTLPSIQIELLFPVVSAGWLSAQLGPRAIDPMLRQVGSQYRDEALDGAIGVCAAMARHPETRPQVIRELERLKSAIGAGTYASQIALAVLKMQEDGKLRETVITDSQTAVFELAPELYPGATRPEDIPADEAFAWSLQGTYNVMESPDALATCFMYTMAAAQCEAEQLCVPRRFIGYHDALFHPRVAADLLGGIRVDHTKPRPVTATAGPKRNAPCPCGSGKKYKRCCMTRDGA